jgi:hypothetical protein
MEEFVMIRVSEYWTLPAMDVRRAVALASSVIHAVPERAPQAIRESARKVRTATAALQDDWAMRDQLGCRDRRPADLRNYRAWSTLEVALGAALSLAGKPRGAAAARAYPVLFRQGLRFTQFPYVEQWAEGNRLLDLVEREGLGDDIALATGGSEFLDEVRAAQREYGTVLEITEALPKKAHVALNESLARLRDSLTVHVSQLLAWGNQSEANELAARTALAPLDLARANDAARAAGGKPEEPDIRPDTPLPPAP